jgi:hypothetical protein
LRQQGVDALGNRRRRCRHAPAKPPQAGGQGADAEAAKGENCNRHAAVNRP